MTEPIARDEGRHPAGPERLWCESWGFDFAAADASLGGYVRLGTYPNLPGGGVAWYWAALVGEGRPFVVVRDQDVALPRGASLEVRSEGLWADLVCEVPFDHWTVGLESFAVALDDPTEAYRGEWGDRVALGFDLEWEAAGPVLGSPPRYAQAARVHGDVLVGAERIAFDGRGWRDRAWGVQEWWERPHSRVAGWLEDGVAFAAEGGRIEASVSDDGLLAKATVRPDPATLEVVPAHHAPLLLEAPDGSTNRLARALCRVAAADGRRGVCWAEALQPPPQAAGRPRR